MLFLVWVVAGIVMLGVNPAGTVHGTVQGRSIAYGMRVIQFSSMTVLLLYIGNLRESELSRRRIVRMLGIFFLVATAGGLLGTLFPYFAFSSPLELVLPAGIRSNSYVQSLVHPAAAQVQNVLGYDAPRPKAPFDYTNSWGNNMAVLGVWFVCGWWAWGRFRRRLAAAAVLAVAAVPAIYSLNRGMWIGVGLAVAYVGIRLALRGRPIVLLSMAVAVAAVVLLVLLSPLGGVIQARLDNPRSNDIRANLSAQAVQVTAGSPILGYGTTRTALGSPQSIAVGRSSSCQRCGNFVIGSNGQLFQLLITVGYGGAALYFGFFFFVVWRYGRDPTPIGISGTLVVLLTIFFSLFYNVLSSPLALTMVSVGLLWRNEQARYAGERD
jgi:O-antigen ligase